MNNRVALSAALDDFHHGSYSIYTWYEGGNLENIFLSHTNTEQNHSFTMKINHHKGYIHHEQD